MRIARLDMEAFKPPFSFVPTGSEPEEADSEPHPALLIDDAAVGTDQDKKFVLVIDQSNHVVYREISVGSMQGNLRVVKSGLKASDRIVVNDVQRARPGDAVRAHMVPMTIDQDPNSAPLAQARTKAADKNS